MNSPAQECELSVVLPAYKEEQALGNLLPSLIQQLESLGVPWEILVVDAERAMDDTAEVCRRFGVRHVYRTGGNSYGDAIRTGFRESLGAFVLVMDADGSHRPADVPRLWQRRHDAEIVIGSRYSPGGNTENSAILILMSFAVNLVYRLVFRLPIRDVTNSFRFYRGVQVRSLKLVSDNFELVEEILIGLVFGRAKSSYVEVPVTFEKRKSGKSKRNLVLFAISYVKSIRRLYAFRRRALAESGQEVN